MTYTIDDITITLESQNIPEIAIALYMVEVSIRRKQVHEYIENGVFEQHNTIYPPPFTRPQEAPDLGQEVFIEDSDGVFAVPFRSLKTTDYFERLTIDD